MRIETVGWWHCRVLCHQVQIPIEFRHAAWCVAHCATHHGDQEPAARQRVKLVRYSRQGRIRRREKPRRPRVGHIEEENLLLPLQKAEQAARCEHVSIRRKSNMMWLIARS